MAHDGAFNAAQETDAVYSDGVLKPLEPLDLREQERVHIVVHSLKRPTEAERKAALTRLFANIEKMNFRHGGPYPTRDELHERR